jgi:histidyl-tRNA synthetase
MKAAGGSGARFALILGQDELASGQASLKDLANGEQVLVPMDRLVPELQARLAVRAP